MPAFIDLTGQRFGRLVAVNRIGNIGANAGWLLECDCGNSVRVDSSKLRTGHTRSCGCLRADTTRLLARQEVVDYAGAHDRVRALRGPAKGHSCVDCGRQAREWSYDRQDPEQRCGLNDYGRGLAYSLDPSRYQPRCKPCHVAFDAPSRKDSQNAN